MQTVVTASPVLVPDAKSRGDCLEGRVASFRCVIYIDPNAVKREFRSGWRDQLLGMSQVLAVGEKVVNSGLVVRR